MMNCGKAVLKRGALLVLPTYGSLIAAINFDRTGTTRIGRFVLNHSFVFPGLVATACGVTVGRMIAKFLF